MDRPRSSDNVRGFRPKRSLAQHFLVDQRMIHEIVSRADFRPSDQVIEIGPGRGALTFPLAGRVDKIIAIEKDVYLVRSLRQKLSRKGIKNVILFNRDILEWDFHELNCPVLSRLMVIGNLPYNISTPFLYRLIEGRACIDRAVLMFQAEVGRRLTASPGTKAYGAITVLLQYHARATSLLEVPRRAFYPEPKVDSIVVDLDFERPREEPPVDEARFRKVVKAAFAYRRKTLLNSLRGAFPGLDQATIMEAIVKCGVDPERRAETLDMGEFIRLASSLELTTGKHQ